MTIREIYKQARDFGMKPYPITKANLPTFQGYVTREEMWRGCIQSKTKPQLHRVAREMGFQYGVKHSTKAELQSWVLQGRVKGNKQGWEAERRDVKNARKRTARAVKKQRTRGVAASKMAAAKASKLASLRKAEEAKFKKHLTDILAPTGTLDSRKNGQHRVFQIYEIPNSFPVRVGILHVPIKEAREIVSGGGEPPHLDVSDINNSWSSTVCR